MRILKKILGHIILSQILCLCFFAMVICAVPQDTWLGYVWIACEIGVVLVWGVAFLSILAIDWIHD